MNGEPEERSLTTADFAAAAEIPTAQQELNQALQEPVIDNQNSAVRGEDEQLAALFLPNVDKDFRARWDIVQRSFVDDPRQAVRQGDELVAQIGRAHV